jgi:hypothetical protein
MAELVRIKTEIAQLAARRKSVRFSEIEKLVAQLKGLGFRVDSRRVRHGTMFLVGDRTFQITSHNRGSGHIKSCYVDTFLDAMTDLGLFDED